MSLASNSINLSLRVLLTLVLLSQYGSPLRTYSALTSITGTLERTPEVSTDLEKVSFGSPNHLLRIPEN